MRGENKLCNSSLCHDKGYFYKNLYDFNDAQQAHAQ